MVRSEHLAMLSGGPRNGAVVAGVADQKHGLTVRPEFLHRKTRARCLVFDGAGARAGTESPRLHIPADAVIARITRAVPPGAAERLGGVGRGPSKTRCRVRCRPITRCRRWLRWKAPRPSPATVSDRPPLLSAVPSGAEASGTRLLYGSLQLHCPHLAIPQGLHRRVTCAGQPGEQRSVEDCLSYWADHYYQH